VRNPLLFLTGGEKTTTSAMNHGSLVDALWTQPEDFSKLYVVQPEDAPSRPQERFREAKKPSQETLDGFAWWDAFTARTQGKTVVSQPEYADAMSAVSMLKQHSLASEIHAVSEKQLVLMGPCPLMPSIQSKCMFDLLPTSGPFSDAIVDLKTTRSLEERDLLSTTFNYDYVVKMAYYGILAEAAGFGIRKRAVLIWSRSSFPFDVIVRELDPADMELGRMVVVNRINALLRFDPSRLSDHYDTELKITSQPDWVRTAMMK
jgi:hypothetical protein